MSQKTFIQPANLFSIALELCFNLSCDTILKADKIVYHNKHEIKMASSYYS